MTISKLIIFVILYLCLIINDNTSGELINCQLDSECPGGTHDKCNQCVTDYELHCDRPETEPSISYSEICDSKHCACETGYYRTYDKQCVIKSQCYRRPKNYFKFRPQLVYGYRANTIIV
ncbi:uncharacterized protein LOC130674066 [Microplitis mediator]|uniref:uncharacterized protein LOC130674066 n=1 Tax=Microplitis mediator TaxID=375433 RepID=UPI002556C276|nr:uncharacterized protein LOC130674066 [Microplitis mediator]